MTMTDGQTTGEGKDAVEKKSFHPHSFINFVCVVIAPVRVISAFAHSYPFNLITSNQTEVMENIQTTEVEKHLDITKPLLDVKK